MEEPVKNLELLSMDRLYELAREYVSKLGRDKAVIGHRFVISTGDHYNKPDSDLGFLQFVQKTLDAG